MFTRIVPEDLLRRFAQEDALASGIRVALSGCGPMGAVIAEFLTQFVPGQRVDRLQQFVEELNDRLAGLEDRFKTKFEQSNGYAILVEQSLLAAVQTADGASRRDFAEMLRTGLTKEEADLSAYETLLRLREQLNESQMLMLMDKANYRGELGDPQRAAFRQKHAAVFDVRPLHSGSTDEERRRWTIYDHNEHELITLGLLHDVEDIAKSSYRRNVEITTLGRMLLGAVGRDTSPAD